jgi:alpha-tubulin suppressor-like RCC1 family protein
MKMKKIYRKPQYPNLLSLLTACAIFLLYLTPTAVTASEGTPEHQFIIFGGDHGQIYYNGSMKDTYTFFVANGGTLPDGIEVIPDSGYLFDGFRLSSKIKKFSTGKSHTIVLTEDGKVYATGKNDYGQLGTGDNNEYAVFTEITSLSRETITDIAAGDGFSIALTKDGRLLATGKNDQGQLGMGHMSYHYNTFTEVTSLAGKNITAIAAGQTYTIVAASDNTVYSTGSNSTGQLGLGDRFLHNSFTEVTALRGKAVTSIIAGNLHSFVITTDGVYGTGYNQRGQLGLENNEEYIYSFTEVTSLNGKDIVDVAAGAYHSSAVASDGSLYVTGWNQYSQLGFPSSIEIYTSFTKVTDLTEKKVTGVETGDYSTVAITSDGQVYYTGLNFNYELGLYNRSSNAFTQVNGLSETYIATMDIGYDHSVVSDSEGNLYGLGNYSGLDKEPFYNSYTKITHIPWLRIVDSLTDITVNCDMVAEAVYKSIFSLDLSVIPANFSQNVVFIASLSGADNPSGYKVYFYKGDTLLGSSETNVNGTAVFNLTYLQVGTHTFRAVVTDEDTGTTVQSNTVSYTYGPGNQEPLVLNGVPSYKTYGAGPFAVSVSGGSGDGVLTFESSNPDVATVDNNGKITIVGPGTFTITARKAASSYYKEASVTSVEIPVYKLALTIDDLIYTEPSDLVYDGSAKIASVEFRDGLTRAGNISMKYYLEDIEKAQAIDAGTYIVKVDITEGEYYAGVTGLQVGSFTIVKASQNKPDLLTVINPSTLANNNGKIIGVDSLMEYRKSGDTDWKTVTGDEIIGSSYDTYYVRYAERDNFNESEAVELTLIKYSGIHETIPNASFNAASRTLSGTEAGQKFRIDGGPWTDIMDDLSTLVTNECTIELYMPGDEVYTTDSDMQTINVTKAEKPTISGIDETFLGRNDGKISGVNTGMEYKINGGVWTSITTLILDNLAPGTYYVRVRATDTTLESDSEVITIGGGKPEFTERTIAEDTGKISVTGQFTREAALQVVSLTADNTSYNRLFKLVDTSKNEVVAAYEISTMDGGYTGKLNLVFNVGSENDGRTYTIYHEKENREIEQYSVVCTGGRVSIDIDELSPFLITVSVQANSDDDTNNDGDRDRDNGSDEYIDGKNDNSIPQTSDNSKLFFWVILTTLSATIIMLVHGRNKKNKFSN